jgi:hypothetical protein
MVSDNRQNNMITSIKEQDDNMIILVSNKS